MTRAVLVLVIGVWACGGDKGGDNPGDGSCTLLPEGAACTSPSECCSDDCNGGTCGAVQNGCQPTESACTDGPDCCSGRCQGNICLPAGSCIAPSETCDPTVPGECCSGRCEPVQGMAGVTECTSFCRGNGASCTKATDCCDLNCNNGTCGGRICQVQSDECTVPSDCCSNICEGGECQLDPANTMCRGIGETCNSGPQMGCCSMVCDQTQDPPRCDFGADVCKAQNATCTVDADCCHGICDPGTHLCTTPCTGMAGACMTGADCCSSVCTNGACAPPPNCTPIAGACMTNDQCCTGLCVGGFCDQFF